MAAEGESGQMSAEKNSDSGSVTAALLIVIGEPFTSDHKALIEERIKKGECVIHAIKE